MVGDDKSVGMAYDVTYFLVLGSPDAAENVAL